MSNTLEKKVKTISGLILMLTAIILSLLFVPIGFVFGVIYNSLRWKLGSYFRDIAIAIDQSGNVVLRHLLNRTLINSNKVEWCFGDEDDTISCVLGRNQRDNNLSKMGKVICYILDLIEKDHCKNSIEERLFRNYFKEMNDTDLLTDDDDGPLTFLRDNCRRLKVQQGISKMLME